MPSSSPNPSLMIESYPTTQQLAPLQDENVEKHFKASMDDLVPCIDNNILLNRSSCLSSMHHVHCDKAIKLV